MLRSLTVTLILVLGASQAVAGPKEDCETLRDIDKIIACDKAIEKNQNDAALYYYRGMGYWWHDNARAIASFNKAIEISPGIAKFYDARGSVYMTEHLFRGDVGALDGAIASYDKAIELEPEQSEYFCQRGDAYRYKGDIDRAIADYDRAIEIDPDVAEYYEKRAEAHAKKGNQDGAAADLLEATKIKER